MRIINEVKLDFKDVLICPKRSTLSSRKEVSLERTYTFYNSKNVWTGVPIIAANMDKTGTMSMAKAFEPYKALVALHKHYTLDELTKFFSVARNAFYSTGISKDDEAKLTAFMKTTQAENIVGICVDVANGYTQTFVDYIKRLRDKYPTVTIMAGNIVTPEMTEELLLSGADIVKAGVGPGSVCLTRRQAGVGYPQLSAVIECADAAHGIGGLLCSDGGCTIPGDVAKAFAGGGDFVMLGGMLAGFDENEGSIVEVDGKKFVEFYGMSSDTAMKKYSGGVANYRSSEGKTVLIPYKGPVVARMDDITGGVRSTCTYVGAKSLKELSKRTTFVRVTQQINNTFGETKY